MIFLLKTWFLSDFLIPSDFTLYNIPSQAFVGIHEYLDFYVGDE